MSEKDKDIDWDKTIGTLAKWVTSPKVDHEQLLPNRLKYQKFILLNWFLTNPEKLLEVEEKYILEVDCNDIDVIFNQELKLRIWQTLHRIGLIIAGQKLTAEEVKTENRRKAILERLQISTSLSENYANILLAIDHLFNEYRPYSQRGRKPDPMNLFCAMIVENRHQILREIASSKNKPEPTKRDAMIMLFIEEFEQLYKSDFEPILLPYVLERLSKDEPYSIDTLFDRYTDHNAVLKAFVEKLENLHSKQTQYLPMIDAMKKHIAF